MSRKNLNLLLKYLEEHCSATKTDHKTVKHNDNDKHHTKRIDTNTKNDTK